MDFGGIGVARPSTARYHETERDGAGGKGG
jgi:hypothetical protein